MRANEFITEKLKKGGGWDRFLSAAGVDTSGITDGNLSDASKFKRNINKLVNANKDKFDGSPAENKAAFIELLMDYLIKNGLSDSQANGVVSKYGPALADELPVVAGSFSDVSVPGDEITNIPLPKNFAATVYVPFKDYSATNEETWKHYARIKGEWEKFLRKPDGTWVHEELSQPEEESVKRHRSMTYGSNDIRMQFARAYTPKNPEQTTIYNAKVLQDE